MGIIAVLVAAAGAYAFGAVWYMNNADRWMTAAGVARREDGRPVNASDPKPYIVSAVMLIIVAGMMRHIFVMASLDKIIQGLMGGVGLGLFIVLPWIVTNYIYAGRSKDLIYIDGVYAVAGCTIMGVILTLFL